jgi:hypothetical protein
LLLFFNELKIIYVLLIVVGDIVTDFENYNLIYTAKYIISNVVCLTGWRH